MELIATVVRVVRDEFADFADGELVTRTSVRLLLAAILGGLLGFEREAKGKAAGLRTHMLVTLGAALFVMVLELENAPADAMSRVIQGIVSGIGFLCAGTILKSDSGQYIKGLTTSASLWFSTAIGIAVGLGSQATAVLGTLLALLILHSLAPFERPERS